MDDFRYETPEVEAEIDEAATILTLKLMVLLLAVGAPIAMAGMYFKWW